jgi:plasmid stabilization system protein ParE
MKEIAKQPQIYRLRPDLGADARLASVGNYVILFRIRKNVVRIERVLQGGRDLLPLLEESESQGKQPKRPAACRSGIK